MRSSLFISIVLHGLILVALAIQWRAGTTVPLPEYVYSVRVIGLPGEGGEPGGGAKRGELRVMTLNGGAKREAPRKEESTVAIPKENEKPEEESAVKPDEVSQEDSILGEMQGDVLPGHGGGGGGGGGSGGGVGGGGGGWGGGVGHGSRNATVEPKPLYIPWPKYPARMKGTPRGSVELLLLVNTRGEVEDLKITQRLPAEELNDIAVQAARKIRFTPGLINGVRSSMWVHLVIGFQPR